MLIAAGEKLDRLFSVGGANSELADKTLGNLVLFFPWDRPQPAALRLQCQNDVFPHRSGGNNAIRFAILRTETDSQTRSLMRRSQGLRFAFDQRTSAVGGFNTEDHLCRFRSPGSQQPCETDDLTGTHL